MSDFSVVNPANGQTLATFETFTDEQVDEAVASAFHVSRTWMSETTRSERAALIRRVAELHVERREELGRIMSQEMGKPIEQSLGEADFAASIYEYYADHGEHLLADQSIPADAGGYAVVRRSPLGPLLGIMPWNYPLYQVARFAGPNIIAGNPILLKHAGSVPESALAIEKIFRDAGAPTGVYINLFATHRQIESVIADPRVRGVSITGSERAGAKVAELAGRHLKKVVLELGGSDPFLVLDTADVQAAAQMGVAGRMENSGQACTASKRHIILDKYYNDYVEALTEGMLAQQGAKDPLVPGGDYGPLASEEAARTLERQLRQAVAAGATLKGGERDGAYITPGVLTGVAPDNPVYHQELFGPVAMVFRAESVDSAVTLANDSPFGLGAVVISDDVQLAREVADRLETGMVFVNHVGGESAELPFGGVKNSGSGRELGPLGMDEFVNKKLIRIPGVPATT